jgi:lambda family phage portal protein
MGFWNRLNPFRTRREAPLFEMKRRDREAAPDKGEILRRWEAAETNRLNQAHWAKSANLGLDTINADLYLRLNMLRARSTFEAENNPYVAGVIETHQTDVVGKDGPKLQVQSDDESWNNEAEQIWNEWFARPELTGLMSGVEVLRLWIRMLWTCGESLDQIVTDPAVRNGVAMRLNCLHPSRLDTPPGQSSDPDLVLGIGRTRQGKPLRYWISEQSSYGPYVLTGLNYSPVEAQYILHQYRIQEPGQARGVPWLACALQPIADLRDYDTQVMDAARGAANYAAFMYADHPDAPYFQVNEVSDIERGTLSTIPPGWKLDGLDPPQPSTTYTEYRKERQREIGRPVNMPLMTVRLGSEDHNYSSARFDGKVYECSLSGLQSWIDRNALKRLFAMLVREAILANLIGPPPKKYDLTWGWPKPPHVDPEKEWIGYETAVAMGGMDMSDVAAQTGTDLETLIAKRVRTRDLLAKHGLPPAPYWVPGKQAMKQEPAKQESKSAEKEAAA